MSGSKPGRRLRLRIAASLGRRTANQRGVALLLEVVLGSLLLALALVPVMMGLTAVLISMEKAVNSTLAMNILQDRAEKLKAYGYQYVAIGSDVIGDTAVDEYFGTAFVVLQEVINVPRMVTNTGVPVVKKVTLTAYRRPAYFTYDAATKIWTPAADQNVLAKWEFLIYDKGI